MAGIHHNRDTTFLTAPIKSYSHHPWFEWWTTLVEARGLPLDDAGFRGNAVRLLDLIGVGRCAWLSPNDSAAWLFGMPLQCVKRLLRVIRKWGVLSQFGRCTLRLTFPNHITREESLYFDLPLCLTTTHNAILSTVGMLVTKMRDPCRVTLTSSVRCKDGTVFPVGAEVGLGATR
jgi:hypothetical protein